MNFTIRPKWVFSAMLLISAFLLSAHVLGVVSTYFIGPNYVHGLIPLFDLDGESTVPSFYAACSLIGCSILLGLIAVREHRRGSKDGKYWLVLAFIFLFMAVDEACSIHELLDDPLRAAFNLTGMFYFGWVVVYGTAVLIFATLYCRFIINLDKAYRWKILLAGTLYVGGALGLEFVGASVAWSRGYDNLLYVSIITIEEALEMLGIAIFVNALLCILSRPGEPVVVHFGEGHCDANRSRA